MWCAAFSHDCSVLKIYYGWHGSLFFGHQEPAVVLTENLYGQSIHAYSKGQGNSTTTTTMIMMMVLFPDPLVRSIIDITRSYTQINSADYDSFLTRVGSSLESYRFSKDAHV